MTNLKFNSTDSFAYWDAPSENLTGKSPKEREDLFKDSYKEEHFPTELLPDDLEAHLKQTKYVLVGMNPGNAAVDQPKEDLFANFHGKKASADYRMAAATYGTELWGTFMTDLSHIIESDSTKVDMDQNDVIALEKHLTELGIPADATLIAMGKTQPFTELKKYSTHPVVYIYHYSNSNNGHRTAQVTKDQLDEILGK